MGRRSWMVGLSVTVVKVEPMPKQNLRELREIVKQVALRMAKEKAESIKLYMAS
jgi:hypothetical protein